MGFRYFCSFFICLTLLLNACVSSQVAMLDSSKSYPPTSHVEILLEKPTKQYKQIAIIEARGAEGHTDTQLLNSLVDKAKSIGADAIIPISKETKTTPGGFLLLPGTSGYTAVGTGPSTLPLLKAIAIKYE